MTTAFQDVARAIRDGLPVLRAGDAIDRGIATDETSFAFNATHFARINDSSIDRLTRYAKRKIKKRPRLQWCRLKGYDGHEFCVEDIGEYKVWIRNHRGGWSVDRAIGLVEDCRVLTFLGCPVLFSEPSTAAILIEAFFPDPPPGLIWSSQDASTASDASAVHHAAI